MKQQFDLFEGIRLRDQGMSQAADSRAHALGVAKQVARRLASQDPERCCDIDKVQWHLKDVGIDLGMAAGSVFKSKDWVAVGQKKTHRKSSHARNITIWRLK